MSQHHDKVCILMTEGSYFLGVKLHAGMPQIADFSTELCGVCAVAELSYFIVLYAFMHHALLLN